MIQTSKYWCIVPMCKSTSIKTPEKTFIQVPINEKRRKLWLRMVGRDPKEFSKTSCVFVCEDHFDLENDMENYLRWKMMGGLKLMKHDAVPQKFECQMEGKLTFPENIPRKGAEKKRRLQEIDEALSAPSTSKIATVENIEVHKPRGSEMEPEKKNVSVSARPYHRSTQTETVHEVISKNCSPFECSSASIGTSPLVKKNLPVYNEEKVVFSSSDNSESATSTTLLYAQPNIDSGNPILNMGEGSLTRKQIFAIWYASTGNRSAKVQHVQNRVLQMCATESDSEDVINKRKQTIYAILAKITHRWEKCHRKKDTFFSKYSNWLDKEVSLSSDVSEETSSTFQSDHHTTLDYQSTSEKLERRKTTYKDSEERSYCRLCLKLTNKNLLTPLYLHDFSCYGKSDAFKKKKVDKIQEILKMLKFCLPFFDLLTLNPTICSICTRRLKSSYNFVNECLKSQRLIEKYADIHSPNERTVSINEMIETNFMLPDDILSHTQTETLTPNSSKDSKNSDSEQIKSKYSDEDNVIAKKRKIDHESQEENLQTPEKTPNIKIEADEVDRSSVHGITGREIIDPNNINEETTIKIEPDYIDSAEENDGPLSLQEFLTEDIPKKEIIDTNIEDETMIKIEPVYIPDFIKTEEDDLHVESELCNKRIGIGTGANFERQSLHFNRTDNVSLDKTNAHLHHRYDFGMASVIFR